MSFLGQCDVCDTDVTSNWVFVTAVVTGINFVTCSKLGLSRSFMAVIMCPWHDVSCRRCVCAWRCRRFHFEWVLFENTAWNTLLTLSFGTKRVLQKRVKLNKPGKRSGKVFLGSTWKEFPEQIESSLTYSFSNQHIFPKGTILNKSGNVCLIQNVFLRSIRSNFKSWFSYSLTNIQIS